MTQSVTKRIFSGERLEIDVPPPHFLEVTKWYMCQPLDWEYDDAQMVYDAAKAEALSTPALQRVKHLPVSDEYKSRQGRVLEHVRTVIHTLETKHLNALEEEGAPAREDADLFYGLTPEDAHELVTARELEPAVVIPEGWSRADELAHQRAIRARDSYLLRALIVDAENLPIFTGPEGERKYNRLTKTMRNETLQIYLNTVLADISTAKNSDGGEDPSQE